MPASTADAPHTADRMPTESEEQAAEESEADPEESEADLEESGEEATVAEHYEEMARKGVDQKGEGRIE